MGPGAADVVVFPPTVQRPPEAGDFNRFGVFTGAQAANTPAVVPGTPFQVPAGNVAVIRSLSLDVNNLLASSNIVWTLRFNQTPVQGWDALSQFPRNVAAAVLTWTPEETYIPVPEGVLIDVLVEVLDGATYTLGASYHGWFYSGEVAAKYAGAWG